jgi:hypothetical protein
MSHQICWNEPIPHTSTNYCTLCDNKIKNQECEAKN